MTRRTALGWGPAPCWPLTGPLLRSQRASRRHRPPRRPPRLVPPRRAPLRAVRRRRRRKIRRDQPRSAESGASACCLPFLPLRSPLSECMAVVSDVSPSLSRAFSEPSCHRACAHSWMRQRRRGGRCDSRWLARWQSTSRSGRRMHASWRRRERSRRLETPRRHHETPSMPRLPEPLHKTSKTLSRLTSAEA